jgi:hypothetical protein
MKLYIAGPMTGYADYNFPAFHEAAATLRGLGHDPLNPATSFEGRQDLEYEMYIREAARMVAMADGMVMLDEWWLSKGALMEVHMALTIGIPLFTINIWGNLVTLNRTIYNIGELLQERWRKERDKDRTLWQDEIGQVNTRSLSTAGVS